MSEQIDIYVGRQPIFNRNLDVIAYELLFRGNGTDNAALILGGDAASAQVMMNVFGEMEIDEVLGKNKGFINFTEGLLMRENQPFFPKDKVVIEVLEDIEVTPKLMESLAMLKESGYIIALDDYVFNPKLEPLEQFADIIKVDIMDVGPKKLIEHTKRLKDLGIKLLAEKVETKDQFEYCLKLGFDYFQGYFFARPTIIEGKRLPQNKMSAIQLLASVYDPDIDMSKLSEIISKDVSLSQKLLKFVAQTSGPDIKISSIHDAVLRFGLNRLKSWSSMLVLSGVDDKPVELFTTSLTRAKFCELVAKETGKNSCVDRYFTVGLFSCLDAVMDSDINSLLEKLSLETGIEKAILHKEGELGKALCLVQGLEKGTTQMQMPKNLSATQASQCYLQAMKFADSVGMQ